MFTFSNTTAVCPHCLRKLKLTAMKFFCVPDEDHRHEVSLSFMDRFKNRLPVCRKSFCRDNGLTVREACCRYCGEFLSRKNELVPSP